MKNFFLLLFFLSLCSLGETTSAKPATKKPKVTIICPTYGRHENHPNLYQAFAWQTYENREMLVLDDSPNPSPFFIQLKDPRVKYTHTPQKASTGSKRNRLIEMASGEIIAHFDDDDYYAPDYLTEMVGNLGDADFIKLSRWLAWRELDGSLWEWDTRVIEDLHFTVTSNQRSAVSVNIHELAKSDPTFNENEWKNETLWGFGFSYIYRKSIWKSCKFEDISSGENYRFVCRAMNLGKKLKHIPDFKHLAIHTLHANSPSEIMPQYRYPSSLLEKRVAPWLIIFPKTADIDREFLSDLFQDFWEKDPSLKSFADHHNFGMYEVCYVENRDAYYVEKETNDYIKSGFIKKGKFWERHVYDQFKKYVKPGTTVIDVGGHIGLHTLSLSRLVGKNGIVHVFEPQAKLFSELVLNMNLNQCSNIIFHRQALGSKNQVIEMNPATVDNEGNTLIGSGGDQVQMERLDDLNLTNISLIKIDVEGFEENVIEGAVNTIKDQKPILIIEMWSDSELQRKINRIEKLGYRAFNLSRVHDYLFIPTDY